MNMKNIALAAGTALVFAFSMQVSATGALIHDTVQQIKYYKESGYSQAKKSKKGDGCATLSRHDCKNSSSCTWKQRSGGTKGSCVTSS